MACNQARCQRLRIITMGAKHKLQLGLATPSETAHTVIEPAAEAGRYLGVLDHPHVQAVAAKGSVQVGLY